MGEGTDGDEIDAGLRHGSGRRKPQPSAGFQPDLGIAACHGHGYGPGLAPGTFAFYDGPSTNFCMQGSATYRAQGGRYPCF